MPASSERFLQLRWLHNVACVAAIVGSLTLVGTGVVGYGSSAEAANFWMIAAGGFILLVALVLMTFMRLVLEIEAIVARQLGELRDLNETVTKQTAAIESIAENTRISDAAKSLAHRGQELTALRTAIRDDLRAERWEAALTLVDEMERRFGFKEEADRFREELDDARNETLESRLSEAIAMVDAHFQSHNWERAQSELDRLLHAVPDNAKVLAFRDRMEVLREEHKKQLLLEWDEAVRRNDTDRAIDILKEVDQYLSRAEAQALQASARTVFKDKLLQLGVQFRFAVMEKRWHDALETGLELVRDYPNARMANEVREALDTLRERARATANAEGASMR